jgi:hypothetical protein
VDIYKNDGHADKSEHARKKATELAQELATRFPASDWKPRAANLIYVLQQNIWVYGSGAATSNP